MGWERIIIEREKLYREVWKTPMQKLAPKYAISDVGLKKVCKMLKVPTPPRGYWAKIEAGQKMPKSLLPKLKYGDPEIHEIRRYIDPIESKMIVHENELPLVTKIKRMSINVSKNLYNPHPLVERTKIALAQLAPDEYGVLRTKGDGDWICALVQIP